MKNKSIISLLLCALSTCLIGCNDAGGNSGNGGNGQETQAPNPFEFASNAVNPEVVLDGRKDDALWTSENLVVVEGVGDAVISIVRRPDAVYFFYEVKDNTQYRYVSNGAAEEVTHSDSVEFYFDSKLTRTSEPSAYDFQVNLGRDGRTRICTGQGWRKWMALYMFEVREGMYEEEDYYYVEAMIPVAQMGIGANEAVGIAFGQVNRFVEVKNDLPQYFNWNGLHVNGELVDPQIPSTYLVLTPTANELYTWDEYQALLNEEA